MAEETMRERIERALEQARADGIKHYGPIFMDSISGIPQPSEYIDMTGLWTPEDRKGETHG